MKVKLTKRCTVTRYQSNSIGSHFSPPRAIETWTGKAGDEYETEGRNGHYLGFEPANAAVQISCVACYAKLQAGDGHHDVNLQGETFRLCAACWSKVERGGRSLRQVVEAVLLSHDPDFGGPDDPCDHEDYRDLELLGLWPEGEG